MNNWTIISNQRASFCLIALFSILFFCCIDPVAPEFEFKDNLLFVDGFVVTVPGASSITLKRSQLRDSDDFNTISVREAKVEIQEMTSQETIVFTEDANGVYVAPSNFAAKKGETWQLKVNLSDGQTILSEPETVTQSVPIDALHQSYSSQNEFDENFDRFIPGHSISLDWTDPVGVGNYYLWTYRTFETLAVCNSCERSVWRGGRCVETPGYRRRFYDYLCADPCWQIRNGTQVKIFSDDLSDGAPTKGFEIANLPYYRDVNIVVEVQQLSITENTYDYYKVIDDLTNDNSGLNAPPPAPLLGNLYDPDNNEIPILGHFTVAATATKSLFIDRSELQDLVLIPDRPVSLEPCTICPDSIIYFNCIEGRFRTAIRPEGWEE